MPIKIKPSRINYQPFSSIVGVFEEVSYSSPLGSEVIKKPLNYHVNSDQMQSVKNVSYATNVTNNVLCKNTGTATSMSFLSEPDTVLANRSCLQNSNRVEKVVQCKPLNIDQVPSKSKELSESKKEVHYKPLNIDQVRSKCKELSESKKEDGDIIVSLKVLKKDSITGNYKEYQIKRALDKNNTISGLVFYEHNEIVDRYKSNGKKLYSSIIKSDSENELNEDDFILDINLVEISKSNSCSDLSIASTRSDGPSISSVELKAQRLQSRIVRFSDCSSLNASGSDSDASSSSDPSHAIYVLKN